MTKIHSETGKERDRETKKDKEGERGWERGTDGELSSKDVDKGRGHVTTTHVQQTCNGKRILT